MARISYRRLVQLLAEPPALPPARVAKPTVTAGLAVLGLTVAVPGKDRPLVEALDLALAPGSVLLLTGPNGVGKSSLLRCLLGIAPADDGLVLLDGQDLHRADRDEIGPRLGLLAQRAQLLDGTVMENISRFTGRTAEAVVAARLAGVHDMIGRLPQGYGGQAGSGSSLSGGQRRQVALARAFFGAPGLIALDEPEAALDAPAIQALQAGVEEMARAGAIIVLVTHDARLWRHIAHHELQLAGKGKWSLAPLGQAALQPA